MTKLSGIASKEEADGLRGRRLHVERSRLLDLLDMPEDEYYHADLIGLEVHDPGGAPPCRGRAGGIPSRRKDDISDTADGRTGAWTAQVLTLVPSAFPGVLGESLTGKALRDLFHATPARLKFMLTDRSDSLVITNTARWLT